MMKWQSNNFIETIYVICLIVFLVFADEEKVYGQEIKIEYTNKHYTIHDGLAQMQVMSLFLDSKGYLWCFTKAGLSRFDGKHFKTYTKGVDLPGFDLTTMGESKNGHLLLFGPFNFVELVGDSVIHRNYPGKSTTFSSCQHSATKKLREIRQALPNGQVVQKVLNYASPDSMETYAINGQRGTIIYLDEENLVWQTNFDSIYISDLKAQKILKKLANPVKITQLSALGDRIIGINDNHWVYELADNEFRLLFQIETSTRVMKIIQTPSKDALIINTDKDLFYFKDELVPIKRNLTQIRDILFDNEENLWVATEEGLYNFFQLNFVNYSFGMGNKDWVWSVLEDNEKNFWFASYQNGLWKWDGEKVTDYTAELNSKIGVHTRQRPSPLQYRYYMGASKMGPTLYFPTECNVLQYENNKFSLVENIAELPFQITKTFPDGTLYCGGYPGLFQIDKNKDVKFWHRDTIGVSSVLNVERDKYNQLVAVGRNGVAVINDEGITNFNDGPFRFSYSTAKDHNNNIWIGGIKNISLYTGDSIIHVAEKEDEAIYSLLFVKPHYLFLGGIKGLYVANLDNYYKNGIFETVLFNQTNGFTGIECGQNGFFTDSEGMVWIPTSDLVTRFDPKKLIEKKIKPPKIYLNVAVSPDNINWKNRNPDEGKKLGYNKNNIRFKVDAVSFASSGNIRYYYRLIGLQDDWSKASEINEITFYDLKPGKYRFLVKADAGVRKAVSDVVAIEFEIENPWWFKWWPLVAEIIFLIVSIYFVVQFFRKRERQKAATQQRLTQLRSEALSAQLDPHFVMNCLNNISGLVNAGCRQQANDYIVKFSKLLRVILQSVKKEAISLNNELDMVKKYMELEQFRCNNCFSYEIEVPKNCSTENILVPPMLLQPIVENSIKHGFGNTKTDNAKIKIKIELFAQNLLFTVSDNGKGIQSHYNPPGTGLGTKITKERIELLQKKNKIKFNMKNTGCGVEVSFQIPLVLTHN